MGRAPRSAEPLGSVPMHPGAVHVTTGFSRWWRRAAAEACSTRVGMGRSFSTASFHPQRHSAQTSSRVTTIVTQCFAGRSSTICGRTLDSAVSGGLPLLPRPERSRDKERRKERSLTSLTKRLCVGFYDRFVAVLALRANGSPPRPIAAICRDPPHPPVPATSQR